jgi:hypothetical protein
MRFSTLEILRHRGNLRKNDYWLSFPLKGNHRHIVTKNVNIKGEL